VCRVDELCCWLVAVEFFLFMIRPLPGSTLFPYTTLFRSTGGQQGVGLERGGDLAGARLGGFPALGVLLGAALSQLLVRHQQVDRSEEHTSELQSREKLVCRLLLEKKKERQTSTHQIVTIS